MNKPSQNQPLKFCFSFSFCQDLPQVARLFVPAVRCPVCACANDHNFLFCQRCGYHRQRLAPRDSPSPKYDLSAIDRRFQELQLFSSNSAYSKQKASLKSELSDFLFSLPGKKTLHAALPVDICRFLIYKDKDGKTQVHLAACPHLGLKGTFPCGCPLRLSYKTVDSYIGKLRALLKESGRQGDWDATFGLGNPAASLLVRDYLKTVTAEQLQARVTPKQATPLFLGKLLLLSRHLDRKMAAPGISPSSLFVLARDQAFFKSLFFCGRQSRGSRISPNSRNRSFSSG